jgi:type I restriction enzyme R subunit
VELARQVKRSGQGASSPYPSSVNTEGKQALYDNLEKDEKLAIAVDEKIRYNKKDDWRDNKFKQKKVLNAIKEALKENGHSDQEKAQAIFDLIKNRTDY